MPKGPTGSATPAPVVLPSPGTARLFWQTTDGLTARLYLGHVLDALALLPEKSVHTCITSPPYWGLRDYGTGTWEGGDPGCDHVNPKLPSSTYKPTKANDTAEQRAGDDGALFGTQFKNMCGKCGATRRDLQLGSEPSPDCKTDGQAQCGRCFVCAMVAVFRGVRRVLRDDGTLWLNLGDGYATSPRGNKQPGGGNLTNSNIDGKGYEQSRFDGGKAMDKLEATGLPSGNLVGVPWRVALALQADGWVLRQDIIWHKPAPMPESVRNRCTKAHEYVFMLTKGAGYFCDMEAIKEKSISEPHAPGNVKKPANGMGGANNMSDPAAVWGDGRSNKRSVWTVSSQGYPGAHFACVDDETEALTKSGWKRQSELTDGDVIAVYDADADEISWERATFHRYAHTGKMIAFDKRDTSQLLTPNHTCLVKSRKDVVKSRPAESVKQGDRLMISAPWNWEPSWSVGPDMAALVGWYAAEGHHKSRGEAHIYQSLTANRDKVKEISRLLSRLGAKFVSSFRESDKYDGRVRREAKFVIRGDVAAELQDIARGKEKSLPDSITELPRTELEAFLGAFVKGDGHTRLDDGRLSVIQKDRRRIEQLQVVALKLGYQAVLSTRPDGTHVLYLTRARWLNVRGTNGRWGGHEYRDYDGVVWCPSVRTGFWLASRDGKPFVTGNTFPPNLVIPMIKAGTSARGCCGDCGAPWERVTNRTGAVYKDGAEDGRDRSFRESRNGIGGTLDVVVPDVRTVGWRPTCECHGKFVKVEVPAEDAVIGYGDNIPKGWGVGAEGERTAAKQATAEQRVDADERRARAARAAEARVGKTAAVEVYQSDLPIDDHPVVPCTVLDLFLGSGTTVAEALRLGRRGVGIDLSEKYLTDNAVPRVSGPLLESPATAHLVPRKSFLGSLKKKD